jgi:acyl-CoA hydrolase
MLSSGKLSGEEDDKPNTEGRTVSHSAVTMSAVILPHQAGPHQPGRVGYCHGGEMMKLMDTAAGVVAVRHAHTTVVTARVEDLNFYRPIRVGNYITVNAFLTFVGHSTMEVRVEVTIEDIIKEKTWHALTAYFMMVALDEEGKPTRVPRLVISSEKERELWEKGRRRYQICKGELMAGDDDYRTCREEPLP